MHNADAAPSHEILRRARIGPEELGDVDIRNAAGGYRGCILFL
jgi:hypothetical protein